MPVAPRNYPVTPRPRHGTAKVPQRGQFVPDPIFAEHRGAATREERIVAHYYLFSFFRLCESAWYQRQANILDSRQWEGWATMARKYYHSRGVHAVWWPNRRHAYSPAFQAFLADTAPPEEIGSLKDIFDYAPRRA